MTVSTIFTSPLSSVPIHNVPFAFAASELIQFSGNLVESLRNTFHFVPSNDASPDSVLSTKCRSFPIGERSHMVCPECPNYRALYDVHASLLSEASPPLRSYQKDAFLSTARAVTLRSEVRSLNGCSKCAVRWFLSILTSPSVVPAPDGPLYNRQGH